MVSINPPLSSSTQRTKFPQSLMEGLSKKRKFNDHHDDENGNLLEKSLFKSMPITDLHLDSPLPLEWQRCLDIKSGQIYFYNTRTQKRTSTDPRQQYYQEPKSQPSSSHVISLDLELHLPCSTSTSPNDTFSFNDLTNPGHHSKMTDRSTSNPKNTVAGTQTSRSRSLPSWLAASQGDADQQQQHQEEEMVAAVCNKCHMLVIMCKISPSCPNCKFMHESTSTTTTNIFKRRSLSLLC